MLPGTAQIWIEGLMAGRSWDQGRDAERIRAAFLTLSTTCDRWPSPRQFLAALPDSTQLRISGPGARPADSPELVEVMRSIKPEDRVTSIAEAMRELDGPADAPTREERESVEAELRRHYGTDRKSQAAGDDS